MIRRSSRIAKNTEVAVTSVTVKDVPANGDNDVSEVKTAKSRGRPKRATSAVVSASSTAPTKKQKISSSAQLTDESSEEPSAQNGEASGMHLNEVPDLKAGKSCGKSKSATSAAPNAPTKKQSPGAQSTKENEEEPPAQNGNISEVPDLKAAKSRGRPKKSPSAATSAPAKKQSPGAQSTKESEEEPTERKTGGKASATKAKNEVPKKAAVGDAEQSEKSAEKKAKKAEENVEGKNEEEANAEVDVECVPKYGKARVLRIGSDIYDAMLNQTNVVNNNNKYFILQVLEEDGGKYSVWLRWGRVGFRGQTNLIDCRDNSERAIHIFKQKFQEKTRNHFEERDKFQKYPGKYDLIKIDYTKKNKTVTVEKDKKCEEAALEEANVPESRLDAKVKAAMELICDLQQMERAVRDMEYDVNKCPLGNISKEQVKAGYEALSVIEQHITRLDFGYSFLEAMNTYYTRIPHCFGMRVPPQIRTLPQLKNEITLLEMLGEIEIAIASLSNNLKEEQKEHPLDIQYARLKWQLMPLDHDSEMFKLIERYLCTTHGKTHSSYKIRISNVFELRLGNEAMEAENRSFREKIGNRMLLWHGSRMSNWFGILSQGLRIAPPEAPITGYMFGKGVYFADCSSKSANYTLPEPKKPRFMVLSEVALGEINELYNGNSQAHRLPSGKNSVKGVGRHYPNPKGDVVIDGVKVPCGELLENKKDDKNLQLLYNEFIVYDTRQICERFLVEINFDFDFQL